MLTNIVLVISGVAFSLVCLKFFVLPYFWICVSWIVVFLYMMKVSSNQITKAISVNIIVVLFILGGFEVYLYHDDSDVVESPTNNVRNSEGSTIKLTEKHDILGWKHIKNQRVFWKRYYGDQLIYDVVYTIDDKGLRVSAPAFRRKDEDCVLFFGGSFTFGTGVKDNETMPYIVSMKNAKGLNALNFGVIGYGAHQMLAALQHGMVEEIINCQPRFAIYQAIQDHTNRAVHKVIWGKKRGPKYVLTYDGEAKYSGQMSIDDPYTLRANIVYQLQKSRIIRNLSQYLTQRVTKQDVRLYVAIVDRAKKQFENRYPGSEFHVLFWDQKSWMSNEIKAQLKDRGIRVHLISDIIPDYGSNKLRYIHSKQDHHPNQLAHKVIANYVSSKIIRQDSSS